MSSLEISRPSPLQYGYRAAQHHEHLTSDAGLAEGLVERLVSLSLDLRNEPGIYTHYPRNNTAPSIIDLTFTRGQTGRDVLDWTLGEDFGSDHLSTHIHLSTTTGALATTTRLAWSKADWGKFTSTLNQVGLDFNSLNSAGEIERASENYANAIHDAIEKAVPKIAANKPRKIRG